MVLLSPHGAGVCTFTFAAVFSQSIAASPVRPKTAVPAVPNAHSLDGIGSIQSIPAIEGRAEPQWQLEATAKVQRTNNKIPSVWILSSAVVKAARMQQRFIGKDNTGKSIDDFIRTLPQANFTNPYVSGVISSANKTINITNTDPVDLVAAMQAKRLTAVDVVTAFCLRSAIIHQVVSMLASHIVCH